MARPFEFDKTLVLDRAMNLFWEKGYFNTSFPEIVDRLEINRSSIYNVFTDKRMLFIEALKHYIQKESEALIWLVSNLEPNVENIHKLLFEIAFPKAEPEKPKGCLVVNTAIEFANHDDEIKSIIETNATTVVAVFHSFLLKGQESGEINSKLEAGALAHALFHQITSLRVMSKVFSDQTFSSTSIDTFMYMLRPTQAEKTKKD